MLHRLMVIKTYIIKYKFFLLFHLKMERGDYTFSNKLGEGTYGIIWKAMKDNEVFCR